MNSKILKAIKQKIQNRVSSNELYSLFIDPEEINSFNDCISSIKGNEIGKEESDELITIYRGLNSIFDNIASDWDNNKSSLNDQKIIVHYQNLESILKIVNIIKGLKTGVGRAFVIPGLDESALICDIKSLQEKMKEVLEKMQQQQNAAKQKELEKKAKAEFGKYIKNGTIDAVSIEKRKDQNSLYATIKLKDDNKNTDIRVSEFLNSEFCKENNIAGFLLSSGDQKEPISGYIHEGVRYYNLGTAAQYGIKFNWYVGERECSITLSASDGSIKIVSNKPDDKDLEKNKDVKIKVPVLSYLSLADAVKTCRQQEDPSSTVKQASANEHCRPLARTSDKCFQQ
ncbi:MULTISPECIES: hypothetical protein [unclassified Wolbachia]|uniref:hypothetical protein n=1 Tax=unclassified Wolbachia TaxID=2640676 RepID=UPI003132C825